MGRPTTDHDGMKTAYIYILVDPEIWIPRYVGCTLHFKQRYINHVSTRTPRDPKEEWIVSLRNKGLKPLMFSVEECHPNMRFERERYYYDLISKNHKLLQKPPLKQNIEADQVRPFKKSYWREKAIKKALNLG